MKRAVTIILLIVAAYAAWAYFTRSDAPRFGEDGYLAYPSGSREGVVLFKTVETYDAAIKARAAKDDVGFRQAFLAGGFSVLHGTKVRVIDTHGMWALQVRVQEGPNAGKAGYVPREFVHRKRP